MCSVSLRSIQPVVFAGVAVVLTDEKEREGAGAEVGAGNWLVGNDPEFFRWMIFPDHCGECLGVAEAAGVADADGLLVGADDVVVVILRERFDGFLAATDLGEGNDDAFVGGFEQRFDIQRAANPGAEIGAAAGAAEIHEIVDGENLINVAHAALTSGDGGIKIGACITRVGADHNGDAFAKTCAAGVDERDAALWKFGQQFVARTGGAVVRAADAARHADVDDILSALEHRPEGLDKITGRDLRGCNSFSFLHRCVISGVLKSCGVETGVLLAVDIVIERDDVDIMRAAKRGR